MSEIKLRLKRVELRSDMLCSLSLCRRDFSKENAINCIFSILRYFFGCRFACYLHDVWFLYFFSALRYRHTHNNLDLFILRAYRKQFLRGKKYFSERYRFPYVHQYSFFSGEKLYHCSATENEASILQKGLFSGKRGMVYTTDNPEFFTAEKKTWFGRECVLFTVDAQKLLDCGHIIYQNEAGEYVTDFVPPECISVYGHFSNGMYYNISKAEFVSGDNLIP